MKGIEKRKHEHLIKCLEELSMLTNDTQEMESTEDDIATLTEIYTCYTSLIRSIESESERYNSLYPEIRRRVFKALRKERSARKKHK